MEQVQILVCRERSKTSMPILQALEDLNRAHNEQTSIPCAVLVGPEGGWSPSEVERFDTLAAEQRIRNVSLGSTVLRTDTAAVTAIAAFSLQDDASDKASE